MAKFKVGDKKRVKSLEWWEAQPKDGNYSGHCGSDIFNKEMTDMCGKIVTKKEIDDREYCIEGNHYNWTDEMFEDEPIKDESKPSFFTKLAEAINKVVSENKQGITIEEKDGSIIITPIEDKEKDLPIDTPVMCSLSMKGESAWFVRFYAGNRKTWWDLGKSDTETRKVDWKCIIPFDKFNPSDIQESLKHNIVK